MKKICFVCGKSYKFKLQNGGNGIGKWCKHDDECNELYDPEHLNTQDHCLIKKVRPDGVAQDEHPVKGRDGVIRFVETE